MYLGLYSEGSTDDRFLPHIIQRTVMDLISSSESDELVEVRDVLIINPLMEQRPEGGAEQILIAAQLACGYDVLIIHRDADAQTYQEAMDSRILPGKRLVEAMVATGH